VKPFVLVALGCFWPGNDASGPNQSFIALATALQGDFDFLVLARDRAPGAAACAAPQGWVDLGFAKALYLPVGRFGARALSRVLKQTPHDVLWLNSVYDREFTLPALAARAFGASRAPIILSPRGEFGEGALAVKAGKKRLFLMAARAALWRNILWHATSEAEARDIAAGAPRNAEIIIAPNLRLLPPPPPFEPPGEALRAIFVGRIVPIKGLDIALEALARVRAPVVLDVFGPPEDEATYQRCRQLAQALPPHIEVRWRGAASNAEILAALGHSDIFVSPTGGENFGHAIFEALACGVPALISDRTPWRGLEARRAGWDLPLGDPGAFAEIMDRYAAASPSARAEWREGAQAAARAYVETSGAASASAALIRKALA
jgi:hypothetical protein